MCSCMTSPAPTSSPIRPWTKRINAALAIRAIIARTACKSSSALVVTPEGLPLAYEVLAGNTADSTTLKDFLARIERQYGKARRVWCWDSRRADRGSTRTNARSRSAGALSRGYAQGPTHTPGAGTDRAAVARPRAPA